MWPAHCQFLFWKDVYFMDHCEDSPWIGNMVLEGWIIFHWLFEISGLLFFLVVSHCRLLKSCSLVVFILLLLVWVEPLEKDPDPYESNLPERWRERMLEGKIQIFELEILVREGEGERERPRPQSVFYLNEQLYPWLRDRNLFGNLFCQLPLK